MSLAIFLVELKSLKLQAARSMSIGQRAKSMEYGAWSIQQRALLYVLIKNRIYDKCCGYFKPGNFKAHATIVVMRINS